MFEAAELGRDVTKAEYEERVPALRVELLNAQFDLKDEPFSVLILLMGDDRLGCKELVDLLNEWMDARYMQTEVFGPLTEEERERPRFWRFWRELPPKGRIGIYLGGWVLNPIVRRLSGEIDDERFDRLIEHGGRFEEDLSASGTLLLKFWLHVPKKELEKRLRKARRHPKRHWQIEESDSALYDDYEEAIALAERVIRKTDRMPAPWHVIESTDEQYRNLAVMSKLRDALLAKLSAAANVQQVDAPVASVLLPAERDGALSAVDLTCTVEEAQYEEELAELQGKLRRLQRAAREAEIASVVAFEGWDAAGKGGCIRRITRALPASDYRVHPIAAPSEEELARHYLWRFWRRLPRAGHMVIFDRCWYGRVLVERVEGFATEADWRRAYGEINDFEEQLVEHGMPVVKFWLHIDRETQLARFREREQTPYKKYKLTDEDYRNREKWDDYVRAVDEMVARTNTSLAPWHLVAANDKRWARLAVLRTLCKALEVVLDEN